MRRSSEARNIITTGLGVIAGLLGGPAVAAAHSAHQRPQGAPCPPADSVALGLERSIHHGKSVPDALTTRVL